MIPSVGNLKSAACRTPKLCSQHVPFSTGTLPSIEPKFSTCRRPTLLLLSGRLKGRGIRYLLRSCFPMSHVHSIPCTQFRTVERLVRSGYQFFRRIMKLHRCSRDAHTDRGMGASGLRNLVWPTSNTNTPAFFARTQRLPSGLSGSLARRDPEVRSLSRRLLSYPHLRGTVPGSLLVQNGASIVYVKAQMGHSSIQVTVDPYGHLIPGANVLLWTGWTRLLSKTRKQLRNNPHPPRNGDPARSHASH